LAAYADPSPPHTMAEFAGRPRTVTNSAGRRRAIGIQKSPLDPESVRAASSKLAAPVNETGARKREGRMAESVYKVIELVGTSTESWEKAAAAAVERASKSVRDLRVAQVVEQDLVIEKGKVEAYRTKLKVSFKYEGKD